MSTRLSNVYECSQASPPHSGNFVKASVSDKKKFFENAMEESHKPSPKPGNYNVLSRTTSRVFLISQFYPKYGKKAKTKSCIFLVLQLRCNNFRKDVNCLSRVTDRTFGITLGHVVVETRHGIVPVREAPYVSSIYLSHSNILSLYL